MSNRADLKTFFETGDFPSEGQYADLIDQVPNIDDDYGNNPAFVRQETLGIPSADVLTLNTIPIQFLPAPGAGLANVIQNMQVEVIFNTTAYATNTTVLLISSSASINQQGISASLAVSQSSILRNNITNFYFPTSTQIIEDDPIDVQVLTGNPTAGDSDIVVTAQYVIMSV